MANINFYDFEYFPALTNMKNALIIWSNILVKKFSWDKYIIFFLQSKKIRNLFHIIMVNFNIC